MTARTNEAVERMIQVARKLLEPVKGRAVPDHVDGAPIDEAEALEEEDLLRAEIAARLAAASGDRARLLVNGGPLQSALARAIERRHEKGEARRALLKVR